MRSFSLRFFNYISLDFLYNLCIDFHLLTVLVSQLKEGKPNVIFWATHLLVLTEMQGGTLAQEREK